MLVGVEITSEYADGGFTWKCMCDGEFRPQAGFARLGRQLSAAADAWRRHPSRPDAGANGIGFRPVRGYCAAEEGQSALASTTVHSAKPDRAGWAPAARPARSTRRSHGRVRASASRDLLLKRTLWVARTTRSKQRIGGVRVVISAQTRPYTLIRA